MVTRMRNLENAARLAMAHVDITHPASPPADGLIRRLMALLTRMLNGH